MEQLPRWNFIEWSDANKWVKDVNYPTNMLYSKALKIYSEIYKDDKSAEKSRHIKEKILKHSFNGKVFLDHAIRENGILRTNENDISEVCQYYAVFFGIANLNDEKFSCLKDLILNVFGPDIKKNGIMPEIACANAFIGNYLRMEILLNLKMHEKLITEIKGYFLKMAKTTGILW